MRPRLQTRGPWLDHCGELPLIHGTLIRLKVEHLPGDRGPKPVWLWSSRTGTTGQDVDVGRQAFLRRFDLEHTFRLFKPTLGWTVPKVHDPHTADLRTWLIIAAHIQLRLARPLAEDLRRPWERPAEPRWRTPARLEEPQVSGTSRAWEDRETNRNPHRARPPETTARSMIEMSDCDRHGLREARSLQPSSGDKPTAVPGVLGLTDPTNDRRGPALER